MKSRIASRTSIAAVAAIDGFRATTELERAWNLGQPFDVVIIDQMWSEAGLVRRIRDIPARVRWAIVGDDDWNSGW